MSSPVPKPSSAVLAAAVAVVLFVLGRLVYRLTLHPLAKFPGPKLAAASSLYAAYYDLITDGAYVRSFPKLHDTYGPVVRITPNELHVKDMANYREVFKIGTKYYKDPAFYNLSIVNGSLLTISDTPSSKRRRAQYGQYFSVAAVRRVEFLVQEKLDEFMRLLTEAGRSGTTIDLWRGFRCLTADIIVDYCYQEDFGGLSAPGFKHPTIEASDELVISSTWQPYFPTAFGVVEAVSDHLPDWMLERVVPAMVTIREFEEACAGSIRRLKQQSSKRKPDRDSIFDKLLGPSAPAREILSDRELTSEAVLMLLAGMDTTANALLVGTWEVLRSPRMHRKLVEELLAHFPDAQSRPSAADLERLPYLNGVIKESLRLSYGAPGRLARLSPESGVIICGRWVPGGVTVSHSNYVYHTDAENFPSPLQFDPERWLGHDAHELEKKLLSFSNGSRACLGLNLAKEELVLVFAHLFRRLKLSIFNTSAADMEWIDGGVPVWKGHLSVLVDGTRK